MNSEDELCHYRPNVVELWGGHLVKPLKSLWEYNKDELNVCQYVALIIAEIAMVPFAALGVGLKLAGEWLNPGGSLKKSYIAAKVKKANLTVQFENRGGFAKLNEAAETRQKTLEVSEKLLDYLQGSNRIAAQTVLTAMQKLSIKNSLYDRLVEDPKISEEDIQAALRERSEADLELSSILSRPFIIKQRVMKEWFTPLTQLVEETSEESSKQILRFAEELAPKDLQWRQEIETYLKAHQTMQELMPLVGEITFLEIKLVSCNQELDAIYV